MPPDEFSERWAAADPTTRGDLLRYRFRFDQLGFARWCWPDLFTLPWNAFHRQILGEPDTRYTERVGRVIQRAIAAPRGVAKTTTSKARIVHSLVYDLDRYVVVLSASQHLALAITNHLRQLFQEEGPLADLYGPFEVTGGAGEWRVRFPDGHLAGVLARSFGTQVRGSNLYGQRPTRIVIDDGERPDRVRNPDQRTIWQQFLTDDVMKAGPREGGLVIEWLGTVLHPDAILARLLASPAWSGQRWQAMVKWPERQDLWEECRGVWADLTLGDLETRQACARAFYEAHREEMDAGAKVLDEVAEPLFRLYEYIWSTGLASFLREKQNEPRDPSAAIYDTTRFARCRISDDGRYLHAANGRIVAVSDCRAYLRWDPATGVIDGDFAALVPILRDRTGYGFIPEVWMRRAPVSVQLAAAWDLAERWGIRRGSIESNGFQRLIADDFRRQRRERERAGKFWQLQLDEEASTSDKDERIGALEPAITNGWLQFGHDLPAEFLGQWDAWPNGDHDDGPDATEGAWARSGGAPAVSAETTT